MLLSLVIYDWIKKKGKTKKNQDYVKKFLELLQWSNEGNILIDWSVCVYIDEFGWIDDW